MYLGFVNSACCIIMLTIGLLIFDQTTGFSDDNYVQVGNLVRFIKSFF